MSQNHRPAAPADRSNEKTSLFEVPLKQRTASSVQALREELENNGVEDAHDLVIELKLFSRESSGDRGFPRVSSAFWGTPAAAATSGNVFDMPAFVKGFG
jgi:hypothetical protein